MESCGGSHWLASEVIALGHRAKLIAPQHVKPFVTGNKNDFIDPEAICETAARPKTHYVPVKTVEQQVLSAEHRVRESLVSHRTATINQVHSILLEFGISLPFGYAALERVPTMLDDPHREIPIRMKRLVEHLLNEIRRLSHDIKTMEVEITKEVKSSDAGCRLLSLPGIGPITASALVADVGDASSFRSARDFSASLGLVVRQYSTGGSTVLLNISKRGDMHLRRLLVQGNRSILIRIDKREDALGLWARDLLTRKHLNKVACALANKQARIVWAVLAKGGVYNPHPCI